MLHELAKRSGNSNLSPLKPGWSEQSQSLLFSSLQTEVDLHQPLKHLKPTRVLALTRPHVEVSRGFSELILIVPDLFLNFPLRRSQTWTFSSWWTRQNSSMPPTIEKQLPTRCTILERCRSWRCTTFSWWAGQCRESWRRSGSCQTWSWHIHLLQRFWSKAIGPHCTESDSTKCPIDKPGRTKCHWRRPRPSEQGHCY